ncbi:unnamed protein product [Lymnaea stagnalis]|uniref:Ubiquitin-like domain-containing protein n=1 Tax=Lymnaea stagnalis TaxID=6523 RepID=A0AAV2HHX1_LYMST
MADQEPEAPSTDFNEILQTEINDENEEDLNKQEQAEDFDVYVENGEGTLQDSLREEMGTKEEHVLELNEEEEKSYGEEKIQNNGDKEDEGERPQENNYEDEVQEEDILVDNQDKEQTGKEEVKERQSLHDSEGHELVDEEKMDVNYNKDDTREEDAKSPTSQKSDERRIEAEIEQEQNMSDNAVGTEVRASQPDAQKVEPMEATYHVNLDATVTVKFVMMPSGQVVTLACTLGQTLEALKTHFAYELKMPSSLIMLIFDGKSMANTTTLADLGVGPNGTVQLEIQSADPVNTPLKPYRPRQEYHMPDVITVRVMTEDCATKDVVVEIERSRTKKPFLGGFRNKNTGVEFHNASAQTMQKQRPPPTQERFCRDTQTCEQKNMLQQTCNTTSTQMTGVGFYVSNAEDKLLEPGQYQTADERAAIVLSKVIILQKNFRRWLAKRYVKKLKEDKEKRLLWERREELRKKKEKEERIKREYARRINPQSKSDFDMLLHCLEKWRVEEMERINSTLTGAERKAAICMLLDQETELLSAIERHKNEANLENRDKRIMAFLEKAAAPKKWAGHDGKLTFMDTPYTVRAKELRDIYNSINMKYLTQDERLDVLLTLKHTVKEHDCKLTQEITELIDREADLLMRGVKEVNLNGLRKRISTLFLQYIKTPTFNPEAARFLKIPQDPSTLRKNINYCQSCGSYLPSTEFFVTSNKSNVGRCRRCEKIENDGRQREDHNYYRVMLKALRKSEEAIQDGSSICYLLQELDLRYLVENIWSNQSVLSAWNDIYDLVLARWDKHQEWSPWNCILLTHDEAEAHKKLFSLEEGYGQVFIHKVTQKHNFARNYFSRLPGMAEILRKKMGASESGTGKGPSVAGHSVAKAQKV